MKGVQRETGLYSGYAQFFGRIWAAILKSNQTNPDLK
jgi:hypothetical protein